MPYQSTRFFISENSIIFWYRNYSKTPYVNKIQWENKTVGSSWSSFRIDQTLTALKHTLGYAYSYTLLSINFLVCSPYILVSKINSIWRIFEELKVKGRGFFIEMKTIVGIVVYPSNNIAEKKTRLFFNNLSYIYIIISFAGICAIILYTHCKNIRPIHS